MPRRPGRCGPLRAPEIQTLDEVGARHHGLASRYGRVDPRPFRCDGSYSYTWAGRSSGVGRATACNCQSSSALGVVSTMAPHSGGPSTIAQVRKGSGAPLGRH